MNDKGDILPPKIWPLIAVAVYLTLPLIILGILGIDKRDGVVSRYQIPGYGIVEYEEDEAGIHIKYAPEYYIVKREENKAGGVTITCAQQLRIYRTYDDEQALQPTAG